MKNENRKDSEKIFIHHNRPIFGGSLETAKNNYLSHKWFQPFEEEPYYCASCDTRLYHKGAFYPCGVNQPKNGYADFTKEDFDNLTWNEKYRSMPANVSHSEIINITEDDAIRAAESLEREKKFLEDIVKASEMKSEGLLGKDVDDFNWELLHELTEEVKNIITEEE